MAPLEARSGPWCARWDEGTRLAEVYHQALDGEDAAVAVFQVAGWDWQTDSSIGTLADLEAGLAEWVEQDAATVLAEEVEFRLGFVIRASVVEACPIRSLDPRHYRPGSTRCRCFDADARVECSCCLGHFPRAQLTALPGGALVCPRCTPTDGSPFPCGCHSEEARP